jgi:hypothetical protein
LVIDYFSPIRTGIDPANGAAPRALQMCADIVPAPVGESIQRHHGKVPAAGAAISIARAHAVDQDGSEALRLHVGWATGGSVAKSGVGFAAPRHAPLERHKGEAANFQLVVDWNAAELQRVVGVENRYRECAVQALCGACVPQPRHFFAFSPRSAVASTVLAISWSAIANENSSIE